MSTLLLEYDLIHLLYLVHASTSDCNRCPQLGTHNEHCHAHCLKRVLAVVIHRTIYWVGLVTSLNETIVLRAVIVFGAGTSCEWTS